MQSQETKCQNQNHLGHQSNQEETIISTLKHSNNDLNIQSNKIYIKCSKCKIIQCKQCYNYHIMQVHHKSDQKQIQIKQQKSKQQQQNKNQICQLICQQCQQNDSQKFCQNCQQHLCSNCSFKIHNKGKRAKHLLLDNLPFTKIQKLFFLNPSEGQEVINKLKSEYTPSNSLIIYGDERPNFIQDFQSLQVQNINKLTIEKIQSCLNRYPLVNLISIHQLDEQLTSTLMKVHIQDQVKLSQIQDYLDYIIFMGGCRIKLKIRKNKDQQQFSQTQQSLNQDQQYDKVEENNSETQENNINFLKQRSTSEISSPQSNKFRKKQSIDFSCGSKQQNEPIPEMHRLLFKKSLKMSNRSLIIQIPETKQYKQSPIKSDRQQGFIQRNLNLLENALKNQKQQQDKTLTLHLDENYHDISQSTMNMLQDHSECKSVNQLSILQMGIIQDPQKDNSFKIISNNDNSCSVDITNQILQDQNEILPASLSLLNVGNISLSTQNSIKKRSKKIPIPYFQPMKTKNIQNLNNSYGYMFTQKVKYKLQKKFRDFAEKGILMLNKQKMDQNNLKYDQKIIKKMKKNVCDQQIQYYVLNLQMISIECIYWILQSIKQDRMMPSQKLVLSRLKESFNIKPAHKLWICIIKYLQSTQYFIDKQQYDKFKYMPTILVNKVNDEIILEYENKWPYEDQQQDFCGFQQWQLFKLVLNQYFKKNKQITGGRYGCVQYVKLNGPDKLKKCSLGRLSYFVQQAINKGLIRYHKTLLIQNNQSFQKSINSSNMQNTSNNLKLFDLQKQIKILVIQVALIDIFLQSGQNTQISLAQIPLTFKKTILFQVNLLQLGFPKLKNILQTLTDKLVLSSSKSHIKYQSIKSNQKIQELRMKLQQLMHNLISQISQIISICMVNKHNIIVQQLYNLTNEKLGFVFDFRVCNVPDFYQFLIYYCHQTINLQFINGTFVAFPKHMGYIPYQYNPYNQYSVPHYQNNYCPQPYGSMPNNGMNNLNQAYYMPNNIAFNQGFNGHGDKNYQFNYGNTPNNNFQPVNCYPNYNNLYNPPPINYSPNTNHFIHPPPLQSFTPPNMNTHKGAGDNKLKKNEYEQNKQKNSQTNPQYTNKSIQQNYLPQTQMNYQTQSTFQPTSSQISTPKFNESVQYINKKHNIKTLQNFKWESYLDVIANFQDQSGQENKNLHNFQTQSFTDYQSIYNILDDDNSQAKLSLPKTVIEKEGSCNNNQGQLYISKITPIDQKSDRDEQCDQSLGLFDESPTYKTNQNKNMILNDSNKNNRKSKGLHTRVYSTTEARTKHERMYSTTTAKN